MSREHDDASGPTAAAASAETGPEAQVAPTGGPDSASAESGLAERGDGESGASSEVEGSLGSRATGAVTAEVKSDGEQERAVFVEALAQFRQLLVVDDDPGNDRAMRYVLRGGLVLGNGLRPFARLEARQYFRPDPGEEFELRDTSLGVEYRHGVGLDILGLTGKQLTLVHRGSVYLPSSRRSIAQDFILGPDLWSDASVEIIDGWLVGTTAHGRYQWHTFADRAGPGGGYNTQLTFDGTFRTEVTPLADDDYGSLTLGADAWVSYDKRYPSRPDDRGDRASSSATFWDQSLGWDLYLAYAPIDWLQLQVSVERGGRVNRDGIINPQFLGHRDEVELAIGLFGRY